MASGTSRDTVTGHLHDGRALVQKAIDEVVFVKDELLKLKTDDEVLLDDDAKEKIDRLTSKLGRAINILI